MGSEGRMREGGGGWVARLLLLVRGGVPVESVGHEEDVGARWDKGVARFHHLKAQEAERTQQLGYRKIDKRTLFHTAPPQHCCILWHCSLLLYS